MGKVAYEADFYGWTQEQASLLRSGQLAELDIDHLKPLLEDCMSDAYDDARFGASDETGLSVSEFPEICP